MSEAPSVAVVGTGALAMLLGARVARAGARVRVLGSWRAGLAAMARHGIEVEDGQACWRQPVATAHLDDAGRVPRAELVLVAVKSHQTADVAARAARLGRTLLTLQNGLGNRETLARAAGPDRVHVGLCSRGATALGPGRVRDGGGGPLVLAAGRPDLAAPFRAAGLEVLETDDLQRAVWEKLAVNCGINPVTALHGVTNGELLRRPKLAREALAAAAEAAAVARALGVDVPREVGARVLAVARRTAANRSSMLQDLDRGALTEIDAICGAVVRAGRRAGLETPVNRRLLSAVTRRQAPLAAAPALAEAGA